jgi:uncharacterized repeat protein (TIGR01451 family)
VCLAVGLVVSAGSSAHAVGTAAGTDITNRATVNYQVGGVAQAPVESSPLGNNVPGVGNGQNTLFETDRTLDLVVSGSDAAQTVSVTPGQTGAILQFSVLNEGNDTQDFSVTAVDRNGASGDYAGTDNFDPSLFSVFVDANGNSTYEPAIDTATYIDELPADQARTVFIVSNVPLAQLDGDIAALTLVAQVAQGGSPGAQGADIVTDDAAAADDPTTIQNVFRDDAGDNGDAALDGRHADTERYLVQGATLTVTKTSQVVSDPVNGVINPKAIPGARIRYTITIENSGASAATSVVITDPIPANTTFVSASITVNGASQTDAADGDDGEVVAGTFTGRVATIPASGAGNPSTLVFDVTVN